MLGTPVDFNQYCVFHQVFVPSCVYLYPLSTLPSFTVPANVIERPLTLKPDGLLGIYSHVSRTVLETRFLHYKVGR